MSFSCALLAGACFAAASGTASRTPLGLPVAQRTVSETTYDGYKVSATFRVYQPFHADALPVMPYDRRNSLACPVSGTADAVIPVAFTLTNTSAHASVGLGADVLFNETTLRNMTRLKFDAMLDNKARCIITTVAKAAIYTALWNRPSKPGQGEHADLFAIVPDYYSAAHPKGDSAYLHTLSLAIFLYADGHVPGHNRFRGTAPPTEWFIALAK